MFKRVLVAYDGSDSSRTALRIGIDLARGPEPEVCSLSIEERLPRYAATIGEVEEAREQIDAHGKRLIVVDEAGRFRGLVDRREILRRLAGEPR